MKWIASLGVFFGLWMLLTEGRSDAWLIGIPTVMAAGLVGLRLKPEQGWRWSVGGACRFLPYFLWFSWLGAIDVAWRSLHPQLPIAPRLIDYELRLPKGTARTFFMNVVSLLPGSVSADLRGRALNVHVLDGRQPIQQQLASLERVIANLFGLDWETVEGKRGISP